MNTDFNWIKHTSDGLPVPAEAIVHVLTNVDRYPSFDLVAGSIPADTWSIDGHTCPNGFVGRITHYVVATGGAA
jgi:hypothetical protein